MSTQNAFPEDLRMGKPGRSADLLRAFYESHHQNRNYGLAKDDQKKLQFFRAQLDRLGMKVDPGVDLGCRGAVLTQELLVYGRWFGLDIDTVAIGLAQEKGVPCLHSDFSISIDLQDACVDAVLMTEVLEHLPYPSITLGEVHRILKPGAHSCFMGTVPIDYHLHRRWAVLRGKRLTMDPTHLHSFSFHELRTMLEHFFEEVTFETMRGTKRRISWLSWNHFVRDVAWFARGPKQGVGPLPIQVIE